MATTTDYDAPRHVTDVDSDSIEELKARRTSTSAYVDIDEDSLDGFDLPGGELTADEELTVTVVPMRADEFRCSRCFLVHHRSQRLRAGDGTDICRDCA